jgi:hypothetical protein
MASGADAGPVEELRVVTILAAAAWHWRLVEVFLSDQSTSQNAVTTVALLRSVGH